MISVHIYPFVDVIDQAWLPCYIFCTASLVYQHRSPLFVQCHTGGFLLPIAEVLAHCIRRATPLWCLGSAFCGHQVQNHSGGCIIDSVEDLVHQNILLSQRAFTKLQVQILLFRSISGLIEHWGGRPRQCVVWSFLCQTPSTPIILGQSCPCPFPYHIQMFVQRLQ